MGINHIAAIGRNRELGKGNQLLWKIPEDLRRFKELTTGHPVIMGRKTFDSLPKGPLPNRTNIVVTHDMDWKHEGVTVAHSVEEALRLAGVAPGHDEVFVIGGGQMYEATLEHADKLILTTIDAEDAEATAHYPEYKERFTRVLKAEPRITQEGIAYTWVELAHE